MSTIQNISNGEALSSVRGKLNQVIDKANDTQSVIPIETSLPGSDASKAGQQFWYKGELWTYAQENQYGEIAAGTTIPVKGYYEYSGVLSQQATSSPQSADAVNNIYTAKTIARESTGVYSITTDIGFKGSSFVSASVVNKDDIRDNFALVHCTSGIVSGNTHTAIFRTYDVDFNLTDSPSGVSAINVNFKIYPPNA